MSYLAVLTPYHHNIFLRLLQDNTLWKLILYKNQMTFDFFPMFKICIFLEPKKMLTNCILNTFYL